MSHAIPSKLGGSSPDTGRGLAWISCSVLLQSCAAILAKQAGIYSRGGDLITLLINPWYLGVLLSLGLQAVCWLLALRRLPLSYAYPFMSLVMPINLLGSYMFFDELVSWNHVLGILLIVFGVALVASEEA